MRNTQNIEETLFFALKKKCFIKLINDKRKKKVRKEEEIKEERSSSVCVCLPGGRKTTKALKERIENY